MQDFLINSLAETKFSETEYGVLLNHLEYFNNFWHTDKY